jgi:pimeloyl-ACP methyl ester carboxylesterase
MKHIIVAGTGLGSTAASLYYAPLADALGGGCELHLLEHWGFAALERSAHKLAGRLQQLDMPATLVGHSQGGLVAVLAGSLVPDRVARVVTICAPLNGTVLAPAWFPLRFVRAMSRARRTPPVQLASGQLVNVVAKNDRVVIPYTSGLLAGAEHHVLPGVGHHRIIRDPRLHLLARKL